MKILHLDSGKAMRGGQLQVIRLLEGLERAGLEQTLLAQGELRRKVGAGPYTLSTIYARAGKADIIHAHDAHSHTMAVLLGRGKPLVVSRRVAFPIQSGLLSRLKYDRANRYLAVSGYVKSVLRQSGVASDRIDVIYDGIEPPENEPAWKPPQAKPRVAILDSVDPLKRTKETVAACRLAGFEPVVGRNLERTLAAADFFLYLPVIEGFGSAILVAAALKKPIVSSAVGGIPEVIADGETGLLTDGSVQQAATALRRLADDPELARSLAELAYGRLAERFSSDIMVNRTAEIYRSLLRF